MMTATNPRPIKLIECSSLVYTNRALLWHTFRVLEHIDAPLCEACTFCQPPSSSREMEKCSTHNGRGPVRTMARAPDLWKRYYGRVDPASARPGRKDTPPFASIRSLRLLTIWHADQHIWCLFEKKLRSNSWLISFFHLDNCSGFSLFFQIKKTLKFLWSSLKDVTISSQ